MFDVPTDPFEPPEPERDGWMRRVLADPVFRAAVIECIDEAVDGLGLVEPIGPAGFARVAADPVFRSRVDALAQATLEAGP